MGLRRLLICLLAATFVFNGVAVRAWAVSPVAPPSFAKTHHVAPVAADHSGHAGHAIPASDRGSAPSHSNDCLNYCNMCNVAGTMPDIGIKETAFSYAAVVFQLLQGELSGHPVAIDPHIPKAIV